MFESTETEALTVGLYSVTSAAIIRPSGPVPEIAERSIPAASASLRAYGLATMRPPTRPDDKVEETTGVGAGDATVTGVFGTGAATAGAAGFVFADPAEACAAAISLASSTTIHTGDPTATSSAPSFTRNFAIYPSS
jgi:hypothetical protein